MITCYMIKKSNFYLNEALAQAEYATIAYQSYKASLPEKDTKLIFYHLHHFVLHATNIDKLLFPNSNPFRTELLKSYTSIVEIDIKPIRRLRNHLEHFDERLDIWVKNYTGQPFFDNNTVAGTKGFPEKDFLRAIDGDTYKFYGEDFNLQEIYQHIQTLTIKLKPEVHS